MTRLHVPVPLRWGDLDAFGHVNNVTMARVLEEARVRAFFLTDDSGDDAPPTAVLGPEVLGSLDGVLTLIARQSIEYLRPVPYQHRPLDVQLWLGRLGGSSMELSYEVHGPREDPEAALYVRAQAIIVMVDATSGRPVRITAEQREAWTPFIEEPVAFSR
ncbi:MAG: thioesterase family protein [Microbacterium sp.]